MTERPTDEERRKWIVGDRADSLDPDEAADLTRLTDLLADPSTWAEPSAGLEARIVDAVVQATPASAPARLATTRQRRRASSWRWRIAQSAAAVVAIVFAAFLLTGGQTTAGFEAQLAATGLVPGATASVDITHNQGGFRIVLDADGLPPLPSGGYYQAWLKNAAGTVVPIGTFSSSDDRITLWSGVSPKDFPTVTVTIEAADNDQASSGRVVLAGDARPKP